MGNNISRFPAHFAHVWFNQQSPREWKAWFLSAKPEESPLPGDWESKCSDLQRLCVLRSLRADRILFSAATYVSNNLGPQFADPPAFDLKVRVDSFFFSASGRAVSYWLAVYVFQLLVVVGRGNCCRVQRFLCPVSYTHLTLPTICSV